jgi:TolB-like protein/DNA-binding winged helix-turn-helix (wHTH) protein/Flp pilus assembly protein TadD
VDTPTNPPVRFGVFELDERAGELRRGGRRVALQPQPLEILRALLERPGEVVTREELRRRVWKNGAYVDFDRSLNKAIVKLRDALGDDADSPRYIETLPRHGYRFIPLPDAHVDAAPGQQSALTADMPQPEGPPSPQISPLPRVQSAGTRHSWGWAALGLTLLALAGWLTSSWFRMEVPSHPAPSPNHTPAAAVAFAPPPHSIAVLPFVNMSGDPGQEYFSDGFTEELLNSLSRINELQVAARTSSFSFEGEHPDITTVAHKLNVASVLEGSVRRSGHTVRVTAQLNNAIRGFHIWSQTYDRELGDVLKLQTEIATAVAEALKVKLLSDVAERIEVGGTRNGAAYDAYLRAASVYWQQRSGSDLEKSIADYKEAVRLDSHFALAYAGWSIALGAYARIYAHGAAKRDLTRRERRPALKAVALAPDLAEGHLALAYVHLRSLDFERASEEFERAIALAPGNARVLRDDGQFAVGMSHTDAGIAAARRAVALDPLNISSHDSLGEALRVVRRYDEAMAAYQHELALEPNPRSQVLLEGAYIYYAAGNFEKMRSTCEGLPEGAMETLTQSCLALAYHKLGRHADAETALAREEALDGEAGAFDYAVIYAQWGNITKALCWLETALRLGDPELRGVKTEPLLDPLRNEPRFQAIERELKFPD